MPARLKTLRAEAVAACKTYRPKAQCSLRCSVNDTHPVCFGVSLTHNKVESVSIPNIECSTHFHVLCVCPRRDHAYVAQLKIIIEVLLDVCYPELKHDIFRSSK